jgi:XTP/dITP diphosphohydrolase
MKLVFATNNNHKLLEIRNLLPESYELLSMMDVGFADELPETHETLAENAEEKALVIFNRFGLPCFADDSGLEVEALGGKPGVYSARYAGNEKDDTKNIIKLLNEMRFINNRKARFQTVIALIFQNRTHFFEGSIVGTIADAPVGKNGFGYDPVFIPDGFYKTFAEMTATEKNSMSHRAIAVKLLIKFLTSV